MKRLVLIALFLLTCFGTPLTLAAKNPFQAGHSVRVGQSVPAVTLPDNAGRKHSLAEFQGRPYALFFFCGCAPCHDCARLWAQVQQNGDLQMGGFGQGKKISTVVIFLGGVEAARSFVLETGLDLSQTLLLTDPDDHTTQKFQIIQCPRVFVVDAGGRLAYTNPDMGDTAPRLTNPALVSRALTVWRHFSGAHAPPTAQKRT